MTKAVPIVRKKSLPRIKSANVDLTPSALLRSKYRRNLWKNAQQVIRALEKFLPISEPYLLGSFTTKKRRPADVDIIILMKTPKTGKDPKWAVDMVLTTEGKHGDWVLADARKWMKQKYGAKKSAVIKLK